MKIGESLQIGTDEEGGNIYIICVSRDDYKPATDYVHTLFLDLYSTGSSISIMFNASYAPYSETLSFSASEV